MVYLIHRLTNLLFFDITLLYCYTNFNSPIICCLSSGDMYLIFLMLTLVYTYVLGTNLNSSMFCCLSSGDMYFFLGETLSRSSSVSSFGNYLADFFLKHLKHFYQQFYYQSNHLCFCCFMNSSF